MSGTISTNGRRYVFAIHGTSERYWYRQRQQRQQQRQEPYAQCRSIYQPPPGQQPEFGRMIAAENLLLAFDTLRAEGGKAPGADYWTSLFSP
jgi:hypothetical protein